MLVAFLKERVCYASNANKVSSLAISQFKLRVICMMRNLYTIYCTVKRKIYGGLNQMNIKELNSQCGERNLKPFRVSVDGNIASGKSTLLNIFKHYPGSVIVEEPVDIWRNVSNHNLLQLLYNDLTGRNFLFESYVQLCRLKMHTEAPQSDVQFIERSIQNNRFVFIEASHRDNLLSDPEYIVLCKWYDWISANMDVALDLIVYLQCPPEVAYQRMLSRGRSEEKTNIPLDYMKKIHDTYEDWLINQTLQSSLPPVLVINTEKDLSEVEELCYKARNILSGRRKLTEAVTSLEMAI